MDYLRYSVDEMFSRDDLINNSQKIFGKIKNQTIEKAIILKDAKPDFILLDFAVYETIIKDYLSFTDGNIDIPKPTGGEIDDEALKNALADIENIGTKKERKKPEEKEKPPLSDKEDTDDEKKGKPLNDFWE